MDTMHPTATHTLHDDMHLATVIARAMPDTDNPDDECGAIAPAVIGGSAGWPNVTCTRPEHPDATHVAHTFDDDLCTVVAYAVWSGPASVVIFQNNDAFM